VENGEGGLMALALAEGKGRKRRKEGLTVA